MAAVETSSSSRSAKSADKPKPKPRRRHQKKRFTPDGKKIHWKAPGFQAFVPNAKPIPKKVRGRKQKQVACEPVIEPETGIHSRAWAEAIVPQDCGFLRLPLEIRMRIYELVIRGWSIGRNAIEPRKNRMKFKSGYWRKSDEETAQLYLLCRQSYVDVVGRGLIYVQKLFFFASPTLMLNYLWVIHPVHLSAIQSIELHITYNRSLSLNSLPFEKLIECTSLKNLFITIFVGSGDCRKTVTYVGNHSWAQYSYALPDSLLTKLSDWTSVKQLRDLKTFRLNVDWIWRPQSLQLIKDFEDSIRSVVVKDGGKDWPDEYRLYDVPMKVYGTPRKRIVKPSIRDIPEDPDL